jgi:4-hydroxymandelate oxidase
MAPADPPSTVPGQRLGLPGAPGAPSAGDDPALLDLTALEEEARGILPPAVVDYYAGGAEDETTLAEATAAWRAWRLRPRVLRGISSVRLATTVLGSEVATPVGVAPWA